MAALLLFVWPGFLRADVQLPSGTIAFQRRADPGYRIFTMSARGDEIRDLKIAVEGSLAFPRYSHDGTRLAFAAKVSDRRQDLYVCEADGKNPRLIVPSPDAEIGGPAWSPDGATIAFAWKRDGNWEIYSVHADGTALTRLTNHPAFDSTPVFSPDGRRIAFTSDREGAGVGKDSHLYLMNADGSGVKKLTSGEDESAPDFSPDGSRIAFVGFTRGNADIWIADADGSHARRVTIQATFEYTPRWSPDGRWIAFETYLGETPDLFLARPDGTGRRRLTNDGLYSGAPSWRPVFLFVRK